MTRPFVLVLVENRADAGGGAFDSTLARCSLTGNTATGGGGALHSILEQCRLLNNAATNRTPSFGGGSAYSLLANCVLWGNSATNGGGDSGSRLFHCTLAGNTAGEGGGVSGSQANNCIIYFNTANDGPNHGPNLVANYTMSLPQPVGGVGNISAAPVFVNPASGDFRLRPGSPGIDAGASSGTFIARDLDGFPVRSMATATAWPASTSAPTSSTRSSSLRSRKPEATAGSAGSTPWPECDCKRHRRWPIRCGRTCPCLRGRTVLNCHQRGTPFSVC